MVDQVTDIEERADYLGLNELESLSADHQFFISIQRKLLERGAKLLVGPRGTGKTHQMRLSYLRAVNDKSKPVCIYTSFNRYYHLEPISKRDHRARQVFHSWVIARVISACVQATESFGGAEQVKRLCEKRGVTSDTIETYIAQAEKGLVPEVDEELSKLLTLSTAHEVIDCLIDATGRSRAVLLLDDAALSLTPDYLLEFFDIFRALKTSRISPKASVYPGSTQYGPRFHVRHDAEFVPAWLDVTATDYSQIMGEIYVRRANIASAIPADAVDVLKYAAFGVPRVFLTMIRAFESHPGRTSQQKLNAVLEEQAGLLYAEFESIGLKLVQFQKLIKAGSLLQSKIVSEVATENKRVIENGFKQIILGLQVDNELRRPMVERLINFLVEAGLLYEISAVSHGDDRDYERYIPHLALLIQSGAFRRGRGTSWRDVVQALELAQAKHPVRRRIRVLMGDMIDTIGPNLPECQVCHAARIDESQKYCHKCGSKLIERSSFERCMQLSISELPLPKWQLERILDQTQLRKVEDFIASQDPASELRRADQIGRVRSQKILETVQRFVEEFLS